MTLSIIIVSYNTKELTAQTIESVFTAAKKTLFEILVVDNASSDGSVAFLQKKFGEKIQVIARKSNDGFAVANNEGMKFAKGKYVLLLNSDTIVSDHAIDKMIDAMDSSPDYGILSCRLLNDDGSYQFQGGALPTLANVTAWWLWPFPGNIPFIDSYQDSREIPDPPSLLAPEGHGKAISIESPATSHQLLVARGWVGGTVMLIRREVIDQIGGLDEKIFMYAEDVEYCLMAREKGWKIGLVSGASIIHLGSKSGSSDRAKTGEITGLLYVFNKHFPLWQRQVLGAVLVAGALLRYVLFGILYRKASARALYREILKVVLSGDTRSPRMTQ